MKKVVASFMIIAAAFSVFIGCGQNNPFSSISDNETSVSIALPGGAQSQTITAEAAAVASGEVTLTKVSTGESITKTGPAGSTVRFNKILPGAYTVTVKLFDSAGELLYEGTASVNAVSGVTVPVNVTVTSKGGSISVGVIIDDNDPIDPGLVLWNKMGDAAALANSVVGTPVVLNGNGAFVPAKFSNGTQIRIADQSYLACYPWTTNSKTYGVDEYTIEFWFSYQSLPTEIGNSTICSSSSFDGPFLYRETSQGQNKIYFSVVSGSGQQEWIDHTWDSQPHHYAIAFSKTTCKLYIDGVLKKICNQIPAGSIPAEFTFGKDRAYTTYINGVYDNIKIFNYEKTDFSDRMTE